MKQPNELRRIDFSTGKFEAGGNTYYIQVNQISPARFEVYQELSIKAALGASFDDIFKSFKKIYNASTSGNDILKNLNVIQQESYSRMKAVKELNPNKITNVMLFCALFCNRIDEEIHKYDERIMLEKLNDFKESNINIEDFFLLSTMLINGLRNVYQGTLELSEEESSQNQE